MQTVAVDDLKLEPIHVERGSAVFALDVLWDNHANPMGTANSLAHRRV